MLDFLSFGDPIISFTIILLLMLIFLIFYLMSKLQTITVLRLQTKRLNKTIDDLDQQTKLIIKSDMELKLSQQEIEDKLTKLTLIKNLILSSLHTLDKDKLFAQINEKVVNDLGFKKGVLLNFSDLETKANIDFSSYEIEAIKSVLKYKKEALKVSDILLPNSEVYRQLLSTLEIKNILIAPIKVREEIYAIFIVAGLLIHTEISTSEEETFQIACMYLGQCLNNITLFENLYHTKDNLEKKIKERTSELVKSLRGIGVANKAKSDFISSVSHELRTPLTSVKGFSSLLVGEKFGKLPEDAKKRLEKIDSNVDKLMVIVNTLLDISRIESGKMEVKIAPFEIVKLIKDAADFLTPQLQEKKLQLIFSLPEKLDVYIDKNLIERVFINLINNSIKFTPENGQIKISCRQKGRQAIISVADTGCGMKKEDAERIFQEFYRATNPGIRNIEGSGLGLSLVKRIIDTHKEKIWVESELSKGTTFSFTLKTVEEKNV